MSSIASPPRDIETIAEVEKSLTFSSFTADTAWEVGNALRSRLLDFPDPAVINISLANSNQLLFHSVTRSGTQPDNDSWVARKRATVLRWGCSTWYMHNKLKGDEALFAAKYMLGERAGEYAIHGGGFPIRVKGVEGIIGVIVVSGLKQEQDHQVVVETLEHYINNRSNSFFVLKLEPYQQTLLVKAVIRLPLSRRHPDLARKGSRKSKTKAAT